MKKSVLVTAVSVVVAACGGDGFTPVNDATGFVNIALTDAPVDDAKEVWIEFTSITLKPRNGDEISHDFDPPRSINLLLLQNGMTEELLPSTQVPVGEYIWMRLAVNAEFDNVFDSYALKTDDMQVELRVPSGSQSGLKLQSGFTVTQDQSTNMVLDWDLRKALTEPAGQPGWHLRPAIRVTDMSAHGTLEGSIAEALTMADGCGDDSAIGNAVYVYEGEIPNPLDIRDSDTDPLVTATVAADRTYSVSFLSEGEYTAAFSCQADLDDAEAQDDIVFSVVTTGVTIVDAETTVVNFESPAT